MVKSSTYHLKILMAEAVHAVSVNLKHDTYICIFKYNNPTDVNVVVDFFSFYFN